MKATKKSSAKPSCIPSQQDLSKPGAPEIILRKINEDLSEVYRGYRERQRQELAAICAVAAFLKRNPKAWKGFCNGKIWKRRTARPTLSDREDALRFALHRVFGSKSANGSKRVSKLWSALKPLVDEGIPPADIPAAIKDGGGIEKLARMGSESLHHEERDVHAVKAVMNMNRRVPGPDSPAATQRSGGFDKLSGKRPKSSPGDRGSVPASHVDGSSIRVSFGKVASELRKIRAPAHVSLLGAMTMSRSGELALAIEAAIPFD